MKRRDLVRSPEERGCELICHGSKHDWYQNPVTRMCQPIPLHREINDRLAKHILRMLAN